MAEEQVLLEEQNQAATVEWRRRMEESNDEQAKYAKKQYKMAKISAFCSVGVLLIVVVCVLLLMPRVIATFNQIDAVMSDMDVIMGNLEAASKTLADADLSQMIDDVNKLVLESQSGVEGAVEKIAALDIENLNEAIADLKAIVEPMARLFKR